MDKSHEIDVQFHSSFMPYHGEALGRQWEEVEPALQTLLGALMDVAGAGWITVGVAVLDSTPATPPWYGNAAACLAAVVGFVVDAPWQ